MGQCLTNRQSEKQSLYETGDMHLARVVSLKVASNFADLFPLVVFGDGTRRKKCHVGDKKRGTFELLLEGIKLE